jgi:uncharacterized OB-fold protein
MELNEVLERLKTQGDSLQLIKCLKCNSKFYIPRSHCPKCLSNDLVLVNANEGIIYSYTIIERGLENREIVIMAEFDGVKVKGNFRGNLNDLMIGKRVKPKIDEGGKLIFTV